MLLSLSSETGSGLSYAALGPTHHSLEDMAIFRTLPNMRIIAPCDTVELKYALEALLLDDVPTYIRIGKKRRGRLFTRVHLNLSSGKQLCYVLGSK